MRRALVVTAIVAVVALAVPSPGVARDPAVAEGDQVLPDELAAILPPEPDAGEVEAGREALTDASSYGVIIRSGYGGFVPSQDCGTWAKVAGFNTYGRGCSWWNGRYLNTGIIVANLDARIVPIDVGWGRWRTVYPRPGAAAEEEDYGTTRTYNQSQNTTVTYLMGEDLYYLEINCDVATNCPVHGTRGWANVISGGRRYSTPWLYSPLQSGQGWCLEGPEVRNWANLGMC